MRVRRQPNSGQQGQDCEVEAVDRQRARMGRRWRCGRGKSGSRLDRINVRKCPAEQTSDGSRSKNRAGSGLDDGSGGRIGQERRGGEKMGSKGCTWTVPSTRQATRRWCVLAALMEGRRQRQGQVETLDPTKVGLSNGVDWVITQPPSATGPPPPVSESVMAARMVGRPRQGDGQNGQLGQWTGPSLTRLSVYGLLACRKASSPAWDGGDLVWWAASLVRDSGRRRSKGGVEAGGGDGLG